jgi:hypothetical protein
MTKEELKGKVAFIGDAQIEKSVSVYVTTNTTGLQLFNIVNNDLKDLCDMFVKSVKARVLDDDEYVVEDYSTSLKREDVLHVYDLNDQLTDEMKKMKEVEDIQVPEYFDKSQTKIEIINGVYIIIKDNDNQHSLTIYKSITNVDKAYTASTFFIFGSQNRQFERQKDTMLKITPAFQMMQVDGSIILTDISKLEKPLHLDAILERETARDVTTISGAIVMSTSHLLKVCKKPKLCKKLRHALQKSKVVKLLEDGTLTGAQIVNFVETKTNLKFKYNRSKTKFQLGTDVEAERFIKLMDDDYLMSELTGEKYDSPDKDAIGA